MDKYKAIDKSARARLKDSIKAASNLEQQLVAISFSKDMTQMKDIRSTLAKLNQCVHEFSAYTSAARALVKRWD